MKTLGLFIGRLNPPHIGHLSIIDRAIHENDFIILLIGLSGKIDAKNPLTFEQINDVLNIKYGKEEKLFISFVYDKATDEEWIKDILDNVNKNGKGIKNINFYSGDMNNDSAYKAVRENEDLLKDYEINYCEENRYLKKIQYELIDYEISATNLKEALLNGNIELARMFCDNEMFEKIKTMFEK